MMTTRNAKKTAQRNSTRTNLPATLKAGGKIWFLKDNGSQYYECLNSDPEWKVSQVALRGKKSISAHWAMSDAGFKVARELGEQLGRTRMVAW